MGSGTPGAGVPDTTSSMRTRTAGATVITAHGLTLAVRRVVEEVVSPGPALTLTGTWPGQDRPVLLAYVENRAA